MGGCLWLDGAARKACRVLRARLRPLGYTVLCASWSSDRAMIHAARMWGCMIVSSDKHPGPTDLPRPREWIYIPPDLVGRKSARDLASHIIKIALGR